QYDGTISGAGGLTKAGGGTFVLTRTNNFTGGVTVAAGTLQADSARALGSLSDAVQVNAGATLDLDGQSVSIGGLSGGGTVTNTSDTAATLVAGVGGASSTFSGAITETAGIIALTKGSTGTLTLNGANTYTGATIVNLGILLVNGSLSAASPVPVANGA